MPTPPYAKALVSVSGGALTSGMVTCAAGATIALSGENTTNWFTQRWEIYDYPTGFSAPSGWSTDSVGVIYSTAVAPPSFTLPALSGTTWGKFPIRLRVNNNPLKIGADGTRNPSYNVVLADEGTILNVLSARGQEGIAFGESTQGDALRSWAGTLMRTLRVIEGFSGGGGSTPTGTGFYHVTGGAMDSAARAVSLAGADVTGVLPLTGHASPTGTGLAKVSAGAWVSAAATLVNADVDAAAAIAGSKVNPSFVGVVISDTAFQTGTNPAATGAVRLAYQAQVVSRNSVNTTDVVLIRNGPGDNVTVGDSTQSGSCMINTYSAGHIYFRFGNNDSVTFTSVEVLLAKPMYGDTVYSSAYGVHGCGTVTATDSAYTELAANYRYAHIIYTGALTAGRTYTYPQPSALVFSYAKSIFNNTTGGFAITFTTGSGTTVAVAAGKTAFLHFDSSGVRRLTADV